MSAPVVVIVGAPNVGKSTLFNRLVRRSKAIVTREAGATRDRLYGAIDGAPFPIRLVDTGGLSGSLAPALARGIERQVEAALDEASAVLMVVDARAGASGLDRDIASMLRRRSLPILLVANKLDVVALESLAADLHDLGLGEPLPVSAAHGLGIDDLVTRIAGLVAEGGRTALREAPEEPEPGALRVAIVGRPNVGKSSLLNRLLGEERLLVSEIPGTTRDTVDTHCRWQGRPYVLVDTAGMRRRGRVQAETEARALSRARAGIAKADVVVLVLDASEELAAQDAHIAGYAHAAHRPLLVVANKWDLVSDREEAAKKWERTIRERLRFAKEVPILLVSARTNQRVSRILEQVDEIHAAGGIRVPTPALNRWLSDLTREDVSRVGRPVRLFLYATQTGVHPPRFLLFCSDPERVHFSVRRRLENALRERFGFGAAPLHLRFRARRGKRIG